MMRLSITSALPGKQSGAVLVFGLITLLVMTLLAIASMGSMTTELRIAANLQNQNTAFQAATAQIEAVKIDININWVDDATGVIGNKIVSQPATYNVTDANGDVVGQSQSTIIYAGCKTVVAGDSLTGEGGSMFLVHEIQAVGNALDGGGNVVGTAIQSLGLVSTKVASCG